MTIKNLNILGQENLGLTSKIFSLNRLLYIKFYFSFRLMNKLLIMINQERRKIDKQLQTETMH
jgi:hypothetical protein